MIAKRTKQKKINGKANNGPQKGTCNLYTSSVQQDIRLEKVGGLVCCFFTATTFVTSVYKKSLKIPKG